MPAVQQFNKDGIVTRRGFEPLITNLKGWGVRPLHKRAMLMVPSEGFQPSLIGLEVRGFVQLSYEGKLTFKPESTIC